MTVIVLIRSFIVLGAVVMSQHVREWKRPKAEQRFTRDLAKQNQNRNMKLSDMAGAIIRALKKSRDYGVIYADSYHLLLVKVALDINHGPGSKSSVQHMQDYHDFHAGKEDSRIGRKKLAQGDSQTLMHEAIVLAIAEGSVCKYVDPDGSRVALHLPTGQASEWTQTKWTVFFAETGRVVVNYIPPAQALEYDVPFSGSYPLDQERQYIPTGRELARLKSWGEQISH